MFRIRVVSYHKILNKIKPSEIARILSTSDLNKAERFHFIEDKHRFIAARILFLSMLNDIYRDDPSQIETFYDGSEFDTVMDIGLAGTHQEEELDLLPLTFKYNKYGKPSHQSIPFHFNWSHSGDLIAVTFGEHQVGIDVEQYTPRPLFDFKSLCTAKELSWIADQTRSNTLDEKMAFLMIWSAKEAVLKAIGTGLSTDPRLVEINYDNNERFWTSEISDQNLYGFSTKLTEHTQSYALSWCSPISKNLDAVHSYISNPK